MRTGKEVWRFHTIPPRRRIRPRHLAAAASPGRTAAAANPWGGFTLDAEHGIVFCGTGSAASDFYGADRTGDNLFANCMLALDARTGKRLWHFQTMHHDLWDHDNPCPPVLVTVKHDGKPRDAVAQVTKTGFCCLLDRKTGEPLFGMKEVPAARSDVPGEQASRTQPEPLKPPPLAKLVFTKDDVTDRTPEAHEFVTGEARRAASRRALHAAERAGQRHHARLPRRRDLVRRKRSTRRPAGCSSTPTTRRTSRSSFSGSKAGIDPAGYNYLLDHEGYPGIKPPWGLLTAIDLNTGEFAWQVPLGEFPELTAKGIPQTGTENFGGTIVTAGGLVFIGGTKDEKFHAFDKRRASCCGNTSCPRAATRPRARSWSTGNSTSRSPREVEEN